MRDSVPADAIDNSWTTDTISGRYASGLHTNGDTASDTPDDGFSIDNVSKHADGPYDSGCRNCAAEAEDEGHFARDRLEPRTYGADLTGDCFDSWVIGQTNLVVPIHAPSKS